MKTTKRRSRKPSRTASKKGYLPKEDENMNTMTQTSHLSAQMSAICPDTFSHKPILLGACVSTLLPERGGVYVDCTLGGGGHSEAILSRLPEGGRLIGIDRDADALAAANARLSGFGDSFASVRANFFAIDRILDDLGIDKVDGFLADLGVSSWQLDNPARGFSYQHSAPLDMRMDDRATFSAYDVVNVYTEAELVRIFRDYGEENWSSRIASFIVERRKKAPIRTTFDLVDIIKAAIPAAARRDGPHPAKRCFQAIRIEVNDELGGLDRALEDMVKRLNVHGRVVVISFHSLEDRIAKQCFARLQSPCVCPPKAPICTCGHKSLGRVLTRKPIIPQQSEIESNPRARSAKMRAFERL